jgi:hypothetical protein
MVSRSILVPPECLQVNDGGVARHRDKVVAIDETPPPPKWNQLADLVAVSRYRKRLPMFDSVHDLLGLVTQIPLRDLRLS